MYTVCTYGVQLKYFTIHMEFDAHISSLYTYILVPSHIYIYIYVYISLNIKVYLCIHVYMYIHMYMCI